MNSGAKDSPRKKATPRSAVSRRVKTTAAANPSVAEGAENGAGSDPAVQSANAAPVSKSRKTIAARPVAAVNQPTWDAAALEQLTVELGQDLWRKMQRRKPSLFEPRWWEDRILAAAVADPALRQQMFRFVDVLPRLRTHQELSRHLHEFFAEVQAIDPEARELVRFGADQLSPNSILSRALAHNLRWQVHRIARRFVAAPEPATLLRTIAGQRQHGQGTAIATLAGVPLTAEERDAYFDSVVHQLSELAPAVAVWPEDRLLDHDQFGPAPRLHVAVQLSRLTGLRECRDPERVAAELLPRLRTLLRFAREQQVLLQIDGETASWRPTIHALLQQTLLEAEFAELTEIGIDIPADAATASAELQHWLSWLAERQVPVAIRLSLGPGWDEEHLRAQAQGWTSPVVAEPWQAGAQFETLAGVLLANTHLARPILATDHPRGLAAGLAQAQQLNVPRTAWEWQPRMGLHSELSQTLSERGYRVRLRTPVGEACLGLSLLIRDCLANPSYELPLGYSLRGENEEDLFMNPAELAAQSPPRRKRLPLSFENQPLADFSQPEVRTAQLAALETVRGQLGRDYPLVIDGKAIHSRERHATRNPSRLSQLVGRVAIATEDDVLAAVATARRAFTHWSRVEVQYRYEYLGLIARELEQRRYELAAWMMFEVGLTWPEADQEVADAIDYCRYYAEQMKWLHEPSTAEIASEQNSYAFRPRGVVAAISSWDAPLSTIASMTAAALMTGNTLVLAPDLRAAVISAHWLSVLQSIGLPDGVVQFIPGSIDDLCPVLAGSPDVDLVVCSTSVANGLRINALAATPHRSAQSIKRVLVDLPGNNAIIIDADADLDEAVAGVLASAFRQAGQSRRSCARVIVVEEIHDEFVNRLAAATKLLQVGPADEPGAEIGPLIDVANVETIDQICADVADEGQVHVAGEVPVELAHEGCFAAPRIITGLTCKARIAAQDVVGPVLVVLRAENFKDALEIANATDYALIGGVYSRSPANLQRARQEFHVGNLFLNRPITHARVGRQPIGGYRLSGGGAKAGGPDYLLEFLIPVAICEDVSRRGIEPTTPAAKARPKKAKS